MISNRDQLFYSAKLSQQAQRPYDVIDALKSIVSLGTGLSAQERELFSSSYGSVHNKLMQAWRNLSCLQMKEEMRNNTPHLLSAIIKQKQKVQAELNKLSHEIIEQLEFKLVQTANTPQQKVFYLKLKADFYRHISRYAEGQVHQMAAKNAEQAYQEALKTARDNLKVSDSVLLEIILNYSVLCYDAMDDPVKALEIAEKGFNEAMGAFETIEDLDYEETCRILQNIRDNITLWSCSF